MIKLAKKNIIFVNFTNWQNSQTDKILIYSFLQCKYQPQQTLTQNSSGKEIMSYTSMILEPIIDLNRNEQDCEWLQNNLSYTVNNNKTLIKLGIQECQKNHSISANTSSLKLHTINTTYLQVLLPKYPICFLF